MSKMFRYIILSVFLVCSCSSIPNATNNSVLGRMPSKTDTHKFTGDWIQQQIDAWIEIAANQRNENPATMNRVYVKPGKISLREGTYILNKPIDCRNMRGLVIEGSGYGTQLVPQFSVADARKPMLDFTGSSRSVVSNLKIFGGNQQPNAGCGILYARNVNAGSAGFHTLNNVHIEGMFNVAGLVNIASECNVVDQCLFTMLNDISPAVIICAENYEIGLDASVGQSTMLVGNFRDCYFSRYAQPINGVKPDISTFTQPVIWMKAGHTNNVSGSFGDLTFSGGAIDGAGKVSVLLTGNSGMINCIRFENLRCEADNVQDWMIIDFPWPRVVGFLQIIDSQLLFKNRFLDARGALLSNAIVKNTRLTSHHRPTDYLIECRYAIDCEFDSPINYQGKGYERWFKATGYAQYCKFRVGKTTDIESPYLFGNIIESWN